MTIDPTTGVVEWKAPGPIGSVHVVTIGAKNSQGADTETWTLTLSPPLGRPVIAAVDDETIPAGATNPYEGPTPELIQGTLPVIWSLPSQENVDAGMTIDEATGVV